MKAKLLLWLLMSAGLSAVLVTLMLRPESLESATAGTLAIDRTIFLPGETTHGHYQIELACNACHLEDFSNLQSMQESCVECHGAELTRVDDSHPRTKFTDPRNADRVAWLDARWCITCHQEHRPEVTASMGLSLPVDYCFRCHETVGEERPTHAGLGFETCASAGCHNFHDNQALYEDFLVEHRSEPDHLEEALLPLRRSPDPEPLAAKDHDAPKDLDDLDRWVSEWAASSHARAGVNCRDCHAAVEAAGSDDWLSTPSLEACGECHDSEQDGFLAGRHGMRIAAGLAPMTPGQARLPMLEEAHAKQLGCESCHEAHAYDTGRAAAEACSGCHADEHTLAYWDSPHARLFEAELAGEAPKGTGVSCATCHLPRIDHGGASGVAVAHNQNDYLRPNEKMVRSSCLHCHGVGFALNALADNELIARNFNGRPEQVVESIHFAAVLRWELEGREAPWNEKEKEKE